MTKSKLAHRSGVFDGLVSRRNVGDCRPGEMPGLRQSTGLERLRAGLVELQDLRRPREVEAACELQRHRGLPPNHGSVAVEAKGQNAEKYRCEAETREHC